MLDGVPGGLCGWDALHTMLQHLHVGGGVCVRACELC